MPAAPGNDQAFLPKAALIAGLGLLAMVALAPVAEMLIFPKLVLPGDPARTLVNLMAHRSLFAWGIFFYFGTFLADLVVAWALYYFLRPVDAPLSLLTAGLRVVYAVLALVALFNLVDIFRFIDGPPGLLSHLQSQDGLQVLVLLKKFKYEWYFSLLVFSAHLVLLGSLVFRAKFIPRLYGVLLFVTATGYLLTSLKPYFFPSVRLDFAAVTFFGEIVFMLWLLVRGTRIRGAETLR